MTNANSGQVINTIEGDVTDIVFKNDRNGKEFLTVSIQQDGLTYPTNVRSRDAEIITRMRNAKSHMNAGRAVWLRCEVKESPRSEGGVFRDVTRILGASLDGTPQEPDTEDSRPAPATASASAPASWGSLDERIAWNSAVNNSVSATGLCGVDREDNKSIINLTSQHKSYVAAVDYLAQGLYALIRRGPLPPVEDAPEPPVQAPEPNVGLPVDPMDGDAPPPSDMEEPGPEVFEV